MNNCPFCDQVNMDRQKLWENGTMLVLYNLRKTNKGRCLVIPKRHVEKIEDFTEEEKLDLMRAVGFVSDKLSKYLKCEGINYGFNRGLIAGQTINHFHFHILPRFANDGLPEFHLFHGEKKNDYTDDEFMMVVREFRSLFVK